MTTNQDSNIKTKPLSDKDLISEGYSPTGSYRPINEDDDETETDE